MFPASTTRRRGPARRRAARRGQSIIVALLVLLLLGLAGALFVTIVARNLLNARHSARTVTADQYAKAGITFADAQLTNSMDGADWRPPLQNTLLNPPTEARELARYTNAVAASGLSAPDPTDPDAKYLEAGYVRYNTGAGRFLLRLTYTPVLLKDAQGQYYDPVFGNGTPVAIPPGKYIKIESIGREGVIDPRDPTTYGNNRSSDRLQSYQVAFQPIGITDYARFETNPDNRSTTADLGVTSQAYPQDTDGGIATAGAYDFITASPGTPTLDANGHPAYQIYSIFTTYGAADAYKVVGGLMTPNPQAGARTAIDTTSTPQYVEGGGSFHANMPVRFFGKNLFYLNNAGVDAPLYQDGLEVAGDLLLNGYSQGLPLYTTGAGATKAQRASLEINPVDLTKLTAAPTPAAPATPTFNLFVVPSNDTGVGVSNGGFSTVNGLVRDGSPQTDSTGQPRSIGRLEPPRMDTVESASQLPRYKAIAMTSPPRIDPTTALPFVGAAGGSSPSQSGYGQSIYINNPSDIQANSVSIGGGSTLVDQWLNDTPENQDKGKGGWNGPFYNPPGVNITLGRQNVDVAGHKPAVKSTYGIRMSLSGGQYFPNADGTVGNVATQMVLYDDLNASNDPATETTNYKGLNPDNDVLIYAEGNVRVHGVASADPTSPDTTLTASDKYPRHITIVTNGTAYIDGSLLKGNPDSTITVLAHDYVCVNTTQFLAGPQSDYNPLGTPAPDASGDHVTLGQDQRQLIQEINFGLPSGVSPSVYNGPLGLYVSAGPGDAGLTLADFDIVNPATGYSIRPPVGGVGVLPFATDANNKQAISTAAFDAGSLTGSPPLAPMPGLQYFDLTTNPGVVDNSIPNAAPLASLVGSDTRLLETRLDPTAAQDLELRRVAILPMDVRIEAVLYAQTGSFFVIPGNWFNNDPSDGLDTFAPTVIPSGTNAAPNGTRTTGADPHFPFYGQPIDMKIIIDGAVSEAQPVDVADQTAWMLKWGWIPQYHGYASQAIPAAGAQMTGPPLAPAGHLLQDANSNPGGKPAIGLQIIYNPQAGYPYSPASTVSPVVAAHYLRSDAFGRPLPFSPKLPVSTALLFAGQSSEPPLLQ